MFSFNKIEKVSGILNLVGDKSISHRVLILAALAKGKSSILNLSDSLDVNSTLSVLTDLGIGFNRVKNRIDVFGGELKRSNNNLYCGNSGTTARLMAGVLAIQNFVSVLTGDDSLTKRPMGRVIKPLLKFGAQLNANEGNFLPLEIIPSDLLQPIEWNSEIASAQVKSCVLLAGLFFDDNTIYYEKNSTRNHTELLLNLEVEDTDYGKKISVSKKNFPSAVEYFVPNDISSAAFFIVLTLLSKNSVLKITDVSLNEQRISYINVLKEMGGKISFDNIRESNREVFGDITVESSELRNVEIPLQIIPEIIDEIPILSVAGLLAEGSFYIRGAKELRVKESDRIDALCKNYRRIGLDVEEFSDGFAVSGEIRNKINIFQSFNDHRIAMAMAILSLLLDNGGKIDNFECVKISNPNFVNQIKNICR